MIVDAVVTLIFGVLATLVDTLGWAGHATFDLGPFGADVGQGAEVINQYFPISVAMSLILAGFVFDTAITLIKTTLFVYSLVPLKAT